MRQFDVLRRNVQDSGHATGADIRIRCGAYYGRVAEDNQQKEAVITF